MGERRNWLLRTVSAGSLCVVLWNGSAYAQPKFSFDLPRQPLSQSLKEYARVSGQQIIFTEDLVQGFEGKPLHATLTAADALGQLLEGTGLVVEHTTAGAVMIRREQHAGAAPPKPAARPQTASALDQPPEEVTVTGLIQSLRTNLDIKRNAPGLVDAVSAEDIGKFPDADLAAAMQRIPGVTVSRGVSTTFGGVPTSTGTATQITVRGFGPSFNETLFDDRKIASGIGRAFDFSSVGADFVSEIDILKSPDAAMSSGSIGATVNIKFPRPLDHPGLRLVGSVSGTTSPEEGNVTPNINMLFSDADDRFGILLDAAYSVNRTRGNHVNIQGWEGVTTCDTVALDPNCNGLRPNQFAGAAPKTGTPNWFIQDYGLYQETTQETRFNGRAALQWRAGENLLITVDDNYSRDTLHALQYGYSVWFNAGSLTNITQNANGTITSFIQPNTPTDFQSQVNGQLLQNNDSGINVKWDVDDRLSITADYDHSQAWLNPGGKLSSIDADVGYGPSTMGGTNGTNLGITLPGGHNLP